MKKLATALITLTIQSGVYLATITPPVALIPTNSDYTNPVFSDFEFLAELTEDGKNITPYLNYDDKIFSYNVETSIITIKSIDQNVNTKRLEYDFEFFIDLEKTIKVGTCRLILIKHPASSEVYSSILGNTNESVSCDYQGTPINPVNIPCATYAFYGIELLKYTSSVPIKGLYKITLSPENCTVGSIDNDGAFTVTSLTADTARVKVIFSLGPVPHVLLVQTMSITKIKGGVPGQDGDDGPGVNFYGKWNNTTLYPVSKTNRSVVYKMQGVNKEYWMTPLTDTITFMDPEDLPGSINTKWLAFGANYLSVATNLLLAENAHIDMLNVGLGIWFNNKFKMTPNDGIINTDSNGQLIFQLTPTGLFKSPYVGLNGAWSSETSNVPRFYSGVSESEAKDVIDGKMNYDKCFIVDNNGKVIMNGAKVNGDLYSKNNTWLLNSDGTGHLGNNGIAWDNNGNLSVKGIIEALSGGKLGDFEISGGSIIAKDDQENIKLSINNGDVPKLEDFNTVDKTVLSYRWENYNPADYLLEFYLERRDDYREALLRLQVSISEIPSFDLTSSSTILYLFDAGLALTHITSWLNNKPRVTKNQLTVKWFKDNIFIGSGNSINIDSPGKISIVLNYDVEVTYSDYTGDSFQSTYLFQPAADLIIMSKPPIGKTDIGTNGISSYWAGDKYFYFTNSHGLEVRIGNYGIKVDSTGLKKFTTSGWQNI